MHKKFESQGFKVVAVGYEGKGKLDGYIQTNEIPYPTVRSTQFKGLYGLRGYPSAWAVGPDGKVLWKGHPSGVNEGMIQKWVEGLVPVRITRDVHKDVEKAVRYYNDGDYGKALEEATEAGENADAADDANYVIGLVERRMKRGKAQAKKLREEGDFVALYKLLDAHADAFDDTGYGDECKEKAKKLKRSREFKNARKADKYLAKLLSVIDQMSNDRARQELLKLAEKYPDTAAGKKARKMAEKY